MTTINPEVVKQSREMDPELANRADAMAEAAIGKSFKVEKV